MMLKHNAFGHGYELVVPTDLSDCEEFQERWQSLLLDVVALKLISASSDETEAVVTTCKVTGSDKERLMRAVDKGSFGHNVSNLGKHNPSFSQDSFSNSQRQSSFAPTRKSQKSVLKE